MLIRSFKFYFMNSSIKPYLSLIHNCKFEIMNFLQSMKQHDGGWPLRLNRLQGCCCCRANLCSWAWRTRRAGLLSSIGDGSTERRPCSRLLGVLSSPPPAIAKAHSQAAYRKMCKHLCQTDTRMLGCNMVWTGRNLLFHEKLRLHFHWTPLTRADASTYSYVD